MAARTGIYCDLKTVHRTVFYPGFAAAGLFNSYTLINDENLLQKQEVFIMVTRTGIEPMLPP